MRATGLALSLALLAGPGPGAAVEPSPLDGGPGSASVEKLAQGDRAYAAGDVRGALFAYQDAVYLAPGSAAARVQLGRAYLALRHAEQAQAQAEQALALDAASADARRLLDDALAGRFPAAPGAAAPAASGAAAPAASGAAAPAASGAAADAGPGLDAAAATADPGAARPASHVYRLTPEPAAPAVAAAPKIVRAATAEERYRAGVALIGRREFARAIVELDGAIEQDQRLAVAYAARASARFGLGRNREAAQDYVSALELEPGLSTPLYGLAECYRVAGDRRAVELYRRYAASRAADVREDLRTLAVRRASELANR